MSPAVSAVISPRIAGVFMSATFPLNNSEKNASAFYRTQRSHQAAHSTLKLKRFHLGGLLL